MKILIVENETIVSMCLSMYIKNIGFEVCEIATSCEKAIHIVKTDDPDIIVMDTYLDDNISGIETAKQIKEFSNAKIIFCTGADNEIISEIEKLNPVAIIKKPIIMENFVKTIKNITLF